MIQRWDDLTPEEQHRYLTAEELRAQLAAVTTENAEQAWEIAKLRYYVEALERLVKPDERQTAADEASIALAQHNPPEWVQNNSRHPVK